MFRTTTRTVAAIAAAACVTGAGAMTAVGAGSTSGDRSATTADGRPSQDGMQGRRPGNDGRHRTGKPVSAAIRTKVTAAVVIRFPGATVRRVVSRGTGYGAEVAKADGTHVLVRLDADLTITKVSAARRGAGTHAEVTGASRAKAVAAVTAAMPGATVDRVHVRNDGYVALVRTSDGSHVAVSLDSAFSVTGTRDLPAATGARHGDRGPRDREDATGGSSGRVGTP